MRAGAGLGGFGDGVLSRGLGSQSLRIGLLWEFWDWFVIERLRRYSSLKSGGFWAGY